jgi:hypothetical protein
MGEVGLKKIHSSEMKWACVARLLFEFGAFLQHEGEVWYHYDDLADADGFGV